mgnify:CR=1 FL=1|tara:strand:+ start:6734 stop:7399 length:666 start_codon:yes stop_codon:yes gene_type:complete
MRLIQCAGFGLVLMLSSLAAQASLIQFGTGYQVNYSINLPGSATPLNMDIHTVFIFEWDANNRTESFPYIIKGSGQTELSHVIPFAPTSAFVLGYIDAIPGATPGTADAKRHLYTLVDPGFSNVLVENHLGDLFSQLFGQGEQYTIDQLIASASGDDNALQGLWNFVTGATVDGTAAAFDPADNFRIHKWSPASTPIPAPATLMLFGLGLVALGWFGRKAL